MTVPIKVSVTQVGIKDLIAWIKEKIHCELANQRPVIFVGMDLSDLVTYVLEYLIGVIY